MSNTSTSITTTGTGSTGTTEIALPRKRPSAENTTPQSYNILDKQTSRSTEEKSCGASRVPVQAVPVPAVETYARGTQTEEVEDEQPMEVDIILPTTLATTCETCLLATALSPSSLQVSPSSLRPTRLSAEERTTIVDSTAFQSFLASQGRIMERVLIQRDAESFDVMIDYRHDATVDTLETTAEAAPHLDLRHCFHSEGYCHHRAIACLAPPSPMYPELVLVAYGKPAEGTARRPVRAMAPEGLVLVWSTLTPASPEVVLTCPSAVLTVRWHPYDRHLILGSTYGGQIVLWDIRSKTSHVPILRSGASGHTHPVYSLVVAGTKHSHVLVSGSTDGRLCVWNLNSLTTPMTVMELVMSPSDADATTSRKTLALAITALAVKPSSSCLTLGTEAGALLTMELHQDTTSSSSGVSLMSKMHTRHASDTTESSLERALPYVSAFHFGPVTALSYWPGSSSSASSSGAGTGTGDFYVDMTQEGLVLSASVDWSVKLWSMASQTSRPLLSFEHEDYVNDVCWSPVHPAVFASVDGTGKLSVWNLTSADVQVPVATYDLSEHGPVSASVALHRVNWSLDGRSVLIGDALGQVTVIEVAVQLALSTPDVKGKLDHFLATLRNTQRL